MNYQFNSSNKLLIINYLSNTIKIAVIKSKNAKKYSINTLIFKFFTKFFMADPKAAHGDIDIGQIIRAILLINIIEAIKSKAKISKKSISKEEAEKILKAENDKNMMLDDLNTKYENKDDETSSNKKQIKKKTKTVSKKSSKTKKVSKK